jgi:hypothetical protein
MTAESSETLPIASVPSSPVQPKPRDPLDPLAWEMPVVCKDCDKEFKVPYRHFQAGVVFHCPHCRGSYVPTLPMYHQVHDTFEGFFRKIQCQKEQIAQTGADGPAFTHWLEGQLSEFDKVLGGLARELRPAGKMLRRKGLAAMFT